MKVLLTKTISIFGTSGWGKRIFLVLCIIQLCPVGTETEFDLAYYLICYLMNYFMISFTNFKWWEFF